jgi:acyl-CoA synthetase (AMP-forming)/AMP-acid ligase II
MVISGGFNIYNDLEAELRQLADVADVAVIGVPSAVG